MRLHALRERLAAGSQGRSAPDALVWKIGEELPLARALPGVASVPWSRREDEG